MQLSLSRTEKCTLRDGGGVAGAEVGRFEVGGRAGAICWIRRSGTVCAVATQPPAESSPSPFALLVRWPGKLLEEVLLMPWTLSRVRHSLEQLPDRIDTLNESLAEVTAVLDSTLPQVDQRLEGVATELIELRDAVQRVVGTIPGVRRALRA